MNKKLVFAAALVGLTAGAVRTEAQNQGVDFFLIEQYDKAKALFVQQLASGNNAAQANYYLGEIAYEQGDISGAQAYYQASAQDPFCMVGLAKFTAKSDPKAADKALQTAVKMDKKNVALLLAAAKVYLDNGMKEEGNEMLVKAQKADKKSPLVYMFNGDLKKEKDDVGGAASEYEQAIMLNRNYLVPYIKIAQIYVNINPRAALERLKEALDMQPDYMPAKEYQARAYYNLGAYDQAIAVYKEFFDEKTASMAVLTDYAASLFFAQKYDEATALINKGVAKEPNHFVLNRLLMYSALERENYQQGESAAQKFFALTLKKDEKYIPRDYTTYGDIKLNLLAQQMKATADDVKAEAEELKHEREEEAQEQEELAQEKNFTKELNAALKNTKSQAEYDKVKAEAENTRDQRRVAREQRKVAREQRAVARAQRKADRSKHKVDYYSTENGNTTMMDAVVANYRKAAEISQEKERAEVYRQASEKLNKLTYSTEAADFYQKYIDEQMLLDGEVGLSDYFTLGQYAYKAAAQLAKDSVRMQDLPKYWSIADTAFAQVLQFEPDHVLSMMFIARTNSQRDPSSENGLAKPHYESALKTINDKIAADANSATKYRSYLLEIYRYLSYYFYVQFDAKGDDKTLAAAKEQDKQRTLEYCQKMLELDPNNAVAKQLTEVLNAVQQKSTKKGK